MHATPLLLRDGDDERLGTMMRSSTVRAGLALRARMILLTTQGWPNTAVAPAVGVTRPTVIS